MTGLTASVVIVSRDRPESLCLCLSGVARLRNATYEVIVVADPAGIAAAKELPFAEHLKLVPFDVANISVARNMGIAAAAGDIVAFIDDDAVPEPRWLEHLLHAFAKAPIAAAGGFVRGRNGISFQWKARIIDDTGHAVPAQVDSEKPTVLTPPPGRAVKTEGTNMAVRRDVLADMGGFDPAFRFYLDETDLNMRLASAGHSSAIVPLAQVHHAYAPSQRRRQDRAAVDLHEIGASQMVFLRKHCPETRQAAALHRLRSEQRSRVVRQMVDGLIEPRDLRAILRGLEAGIADGRVRPLPKLTPLPRAEHGFAAFPTQALGDVRVIAGRVWSRRKLHAAAASAAQKGDTVSLFVLSPTALFHKVRFRLPGYWSQAGGLWGRSDRAQPLWRSWRFSRRIQNETSRVEKLR